jgi:hypothetical protein
MQSAIGEELRGQYQVARDLPVNADRKITPIGITGTPQAIDFVELG